VKWSNGTYLGEVVETFRPKSLLPYFHQYRGKLAVANSEIPADPSVQISHFLLRGGWATDQDETFNVRLTRTWSKKLPTMPGFWNPVVSQPEIVTASLPRQMAA